MKSEEIAHTAETPPFLSPSPAEKSFAVWALSLSTAVKRLGRPD